MEPISTSEIPMLREFGECTESDERDSFDSLRLSPWVQARIKELDIHGRREAKPVELMLTKVVADRRRSCHRG